MATTPAPPSAEQASEVPSASREPPTSVPQPSSLTAIQTPSANIQSAEQDPGVPSDTPEPPPASASQPTSPSSGTPAAPPPSPVDKGDEGRDNDTPPNVNGGSADRDYATLDDFPNKGDKAFVIET